jgi:hypothetical protein
LPADRPAQEASGGAVVALSDTAFLIAAKLLHPNRPWIVSKSVNTRQLTGTTQVLSLSETDF